MVALRNPSAQYDPDASNGLHLLAAASAFAQTHFQVAIRPYAPGSTARDGRSHFQSNRLIMKSATVSDILDFLNG